MLCNLFVAHSTQAFCPTESFLRDMFIVKSPVNVLEQCRRPKVGGVFLVIVIQTYDSLKDLLLHHKHPQFTRSCLLQQFFNVKSPSVISSQRSCKATRMCLRGHRPPGGIPLADGTRVEEGSLVQLNAAVCGLVSAPSAWRKTEPRLPKVML